MIATETLWPHQEYAIAEVPRLIWDGKTRICLTSPTGGGKTVILCNLIEWALSMGWKVVVYTNRKLLIGQLSRVLAKHGISFGVRAAGHDDNRHRDVQVSSLPTENARVFRSEQWNIHGDGDKVLALVDEAHLNAGSVAQKVLGLHIEHGGAYVGVTATPIGLAHLYDTLVVAGTPTELRKCGALVKAFHYGPDEPDMKDFKQNVKTGEYTEGDVKKAIMTKCVFARVLEHYQTLNPSQTPTILFGPGVEESIWFAEQFRAAGIRAAHIDGEGAWLDGTYSRGIDRDELLESVRRGDIKVLCNRFVLREGLDLPEVSHLILATVMGSLRTYLQSAGRGLRACAGKECLTIQDHGGHWHRHGSVNIDREWKLNLTENIIAGLRQDEFREKKSREPICCPECSMVRMGGAACPQCGHEASHKTRKVIQKDGTLKEMQGDVYKPKRVREFPNTIQLWTQCYHRAKNSKNRMTFRQAEGLFVYENHYSPPRNLPLMPLDPMGWFLPVADVPPEKLRART